ncbi:hypothetical protein GALMADRAFT_205037 [Galerina marginata CBS 339.88]|uniref:Uncharacterized protein n=1 Tax=Galerina marginata (strain CBS 339.88) TaxID=685588 RepID=A0A067U059_GALM3|nr:hypothetical protein GALMADRAFT_205037 [Galerina marginata CBS 339.88]
MSIFLGKFGKPLFFRFTIFVGIIALVAFIIDLVLFFSLQKTLAGNGTVAIGIGTWFTLVACVMLLVGGCLFKVQANRISRGDLMLNQGRSDIELLRHTLLETLGSHTQQSQRLSETGNTPTPIREIVTSNFNTVDNRQPFSGQSQIIEADATLRPSTDNQKLRGILVKKSVPSIDSSKPARSPLASPSGYAPSSYRTYRSSSVFSTQTAENLSAELLDIPLSRASSNVRSASTRETSRRSTVELSRALSWTSARSRSRSKRPHKADAILRAMPSTSTLSSFINDLPPVPRVESAYHPYSIFTTGRGRVAAPPFPIPSGQRQELATGSDLVGPLKVRPFDDDITINGRKSLDDYSGSRATSVASVKTQFASNIA